MIDFHLSWKKDTWTGVSFLEKSYAEKDITEDILHNFVILDEILVYL